MGHIEKTVFISYRRTNLPWALAVYQHLSSHGYDVFFDYKSINSGDFEQIIIGNIMARAHFLILLTPSALERCTETGDWLRREIETALDEKRNIVPLFFEGFNFGSPSIAKFISGKLNLLKNYNGINVHADYFDEAMERLEIRFLNAPLDSILHPVSEAVKSATKEQQELAGQNTSVHKIDLEVQMLLERGNKEYEENSFSEAIQIFTESIRLAPDNALAYQCRGKAHWANNNPDEAIRDCEDALRLKPDFAEAYNYRGNARRAKNDLVGAIRDYDMAIHYQPEYAIAYHNRGSARWSQGDLDGAIQDFDEAIRLQPDFASAYRVRGMLYHAKRDWDKAIKDFSQAIQLNPDYAEAYNGRGISILNKNTVLKIMFDKNEQKEIELGKAIRDCTQAIQLKSNFFEAYKNRGDIYKALDRLDMAIKDYTEAIRIKSDFADAYTERGHVYEELKKPHLAMQDYSEAIRVKPDYSPAYYARANLRESMGNINGAAADKEIHLMLLSEIGKKLKKQK